MKRLLVLALLLAGCGEASHAKPQVAPPPRLATRCGIAHVKWSTLWFPAADGTRLDGAEGGSGPRGLIMLHESPADLCGWEPSGARLARQGFHVLLVDLRGFGLSHKGPYGGLRGAKADVRGAIAELSQRGARKIVVVGASWDAVTALATAPTVGSQIVGIASLSGELDLGSGLNALAAMPKIRVPVRNMGSRDDRSSSSTAQSKAGTCSRSKTRNVRTGSSWVSYGA